MNTVFSDPNLAGMPGPMELFIIFLIVLVVFGAKKLPAIGDGLGKGIRNFKRSFEKDEQDVTARKVEYAALTADHQDDVHLESTKRETHS